MTGQIKNRLLYLSTHDKQIFDKAVFNSAMNYCKAIVVKQNLQHYKAVKNPKPLNKGNYDNHLNNVSFSFCSFFLGKDRLQKVSNVNFSPYFLSTQNTQNMKLAQFISY